MANANSGCVFGALARAERAALRRPGEVVGSKKKIFFLLLSDLVLWLDHLRPRPLPEELGGR
jgi:hypothetical protein